MFLASVLEQLDLALEQIAKGDVHYARFGIMLTDNAIELMLHQIAKDQASKLRFRREERPYQRVLDDALGRAFEAKVKFAKLEGSLSDEVARSITILHGYRNELYHVGILHETILPVLSMYYFDVVCNYLSYYKPDGLDWDSHLKLPERAKKYFHGDRWMPGGSDDFANGCRALRKACGHNPFQMITVLANEIDKIIVQQDICIDVIARGVYARDETTRDKAVVNTQAWYLAFSEDGKAFAFQHGWSGSLAQLVDWLAENYPFKHRSDPIPSWRAQVGRLRSNKSPHAVLTNYQSFMAATANIREALETSASAVEMAIETVIERERGG